MAPGAVQKCWGSVNKSGVVAGFNVEGFRFLEPEDGNGRIRVIMSNPLTSAKGYSPWSQSAYFTGWPGAGCVQTWAVPVDASTFDIYLDGIDPRSVDVTVNFGVHGS